LDELDARAALTTAARHYLGVEGYTTCQVDRDITDGLAFGARRPRRLDDHAISRGSAQRGVRQERPRQDVARRD
jgi:hypothetical protein